jgi:acyl carrier protein
MSTVTSNNVSHWLTEYISKLVQLPIAEIQPDAEFSTFGIDSSGAVGLAVDLGDWAGVSVEPTLVYDYPTIDALSEHVVHLVRNTASVQSTLTA